MDKRHFTIDGQEHAWEAIRFDEPWNGWLTPVVTRGTLESILDVLGEGHRWDEAEAVVWLTVELCPGETHDPETEDRVHPDDDGHFDLGQLGWVFDWA